MRRLKVLFVCIGNSCRSPMAEAFAQRYGADVMEARSAGLAPAMSISPLTRRVMAEKNIDLTDAFPKEIPDPLLSQFDIVVNISGRPLPRTVSTSVREWKIDDPIGAKEEVYRRVAGEIEQRVVALVLELRQLKREWKR